MQKIIMVRLLATLLACMSIVSISCTDNSNKIIKYLKKTPATLMDLGLYRLSKRLEKIEVYSDDLVYELEGSASLQSNTEGKTVISVFLSIPSGKARPKDKSKAKLLCIDSINTVKHELGVLIMEHLGRSSFTGSYFSLKKEKRRRDLDNSTEIVTYISYKGEGNHVVCRSPLLGSDIKFHKFKDPKR